MERKGIVWTILGFIILIAIFVFYLFTAVRDLVSLGNAKKIESSLTEIHEDGISVEGDFYYLDKRFECSMEHSVNFIPTGTEYYYLLYSNDLASCIFVRASEDYADEFFEEVNLPNADGLYYGTHLKGRVRELDSQIARDLSNTINQLNAEGITVITSGSEVLYIDLTTKFQGILRLITSFALLVSLILIIILAKFKGDVEIGQDLGSFKPIGIIAVVLLVASILSMIYSINFIF
ncbi:MAG: hypothetical protein IKS98_02535 [Lachnospiraceae bacterium]|nr:hypothetical protein [Lachnospiraceae bacterium]